MLNLAPVYQSGKPELHHKGSLHTPNNPEKLVPLKKPPVQKSSSMIELEILGVHSQVSIASEQSSSQYINDINELAKIMKRIKFFEERKIVEEEDLREIAKCLTFESYEREDIIIEYNDEAEKFYIILKG